MKAVVKFLAASLMAGASFGSFAADAPAAPAVDKAAVMQNLLQQVRRAETEEARLNAERIAKFKADRAQQAALLAEAKAAWNREEARSNELKATFDANETELAKLSDSLDQKKGEFGELFGVVRQVAGDLKARVDNSQVSAQFPGREAFLGDLATRTALPSLQELEALWGAMLQEMRESGKVVSFDATVVHPDGTRSSQKVTRIGQFNLVTPEGYAFYNAPTKEIQLLTKQPEHATAAIAFQGVTDGVAPVVVDPSRGAIMSLQTQAVGLAARMIPWSPNHQGGEVGWVIFFVLAVCALLVLWRFFDLFTVGGKVSAQMKNPSKPGNNPLGRVLKTYFDNTSVDQETMELKLDEAILKEIPKIERGIAFVKVGAAVGPLLGLLGTVQGMIQTFQQITLFGAGDPKLMANGISTALVTTIQGLVCAIPLVFLHSIVQGKAKGLIHVLEEQSAGLIAEHAEKHK